LVGSSCPVVSSLGLLNHRLKAAIPPASFRSKYVVYDREVHNGTAMIRPKAGLNGYFLSISFLSVRNHSSKLISPKFLKKEQKSFMVMKCQVCLSGKVFQKKQKILKKTCHVFSGESLFDCEAKMVAMAIETLAQITTPLEFRLLTEDEKKCDLQRLIHTEMS